MPDPFPLIARGRDADVLDRGDGTVLRRYRRRNVPDREVEVMRYARANGYPVPAVVSVAGTDLVLERIDGATMQDALMADLARIGKLAAQLAALHHRLHRIAAPPWLRERAPGDRLLHLDLHPKNVILSASGPVVIDWANAASGPAALDPALAIAIFVTAKADAGPDVRRHIDAFIDAFKVHFAADGLRAAMPQAIAMRLADANVTDRERQELEGMRRAR